MDCIFCKIVNRLITADIIYETDKVLAFNDINPQSPLHALIIPKKHIKDLNSLSIGDREILWDVFEAIQKIALQKNLEKGYRVVVNCGPLAGQEVHHLHFHILSGRRMNWPPG